MDMTDVVRKMSMTHDERFGTMAFAATATDVSEPVPTEPYCCDDTAPDAEAYNTLTMEDVPCNRRPKNFSGTPWHERMVEVDCPKYTFCGCLTVSRFVFSRFEDSFRHAVVGLLPAMCVAFVPTVTTTWNAPAMIVVMCIIAPQRTTGLTFMIIGALIRAIALFLISIQIVLAYNPGQHWALWGFTYIFVVFWLATLTEGITTKITIFLFTGHMVLNFTEGLVVPMFSVEFLAPLGIGLLIAMFVPMFPFPRTNRSAAEGQLQAVFRALSILFEGISESVFCTNNTIRLVNLTRLQAVREGVSNCIAEARTNLLFATYEPFTSRMQRSRLRGRLELAEKLLRVIDSLLTFLVSISKFGSKFDDSPRLALWAGPIIKGLSTAGVFMEGFCNSLCNLDEEIGTEQHAKLDTMQNIVTAAYKAGRNAAFYQWSNPSLLRDGFPWTEFNFFLFNIGHFMATCAKYDADHVFESVKKSTEVSWICWVVTAPKFWFLDLVAQLKALCSKDRQAWLKVGEATKLAFATITALAFFFATGAADPAAGAATIAFIKDANPASNVLGAVDFVMGASLGSVAGFVAASYATNLTELIAYATVLAFIFSFIRNGTRYKQMAFIALFICVSGMAPGPVASDKTIFAGKITQNVLAMTWLGLTHLVLFPTWPTSQLKAKICDALEQARETADSITFCIGSSSCWMGKAKLAQLTHTISEMRALLGSCSDEPSMKSREFATKEARAVIDSIANVESILRVAVIALKFTMVDHACEIELEQEAQSIPFHMVSALQKRTGDVSMTVDRIFRNLETTVSLTSHSDLAGELIRGHEIFSVGVDRLVEVALDAFFDSRVSRKLTRPYRIPAAHTLVHIWQLLTPAMMELILACISWNHALQQQ